MSYLRVRNFWDYQNADAWKKAERNKGGHRHPAWCKLFVVRDFELDALPPVTRLVFYELLKLATVYGNAIPNESEAIVRAISLPKEDVTQAIAQLLEGRWIVETRTARPSRNLSRKSLETFSPRVEQSREEKKVLSSSTSDSVQNGTAGFDKNGALPFEQLYEVEQILARVNGADENSRDVLVSYAANLPAGVLVDIRERAAGKSIRWAVGAVKAEAEKRSA